MDWKENEFLSRIIRRYSRNWKTNVKTGMEEKNNNVETGGKMKTFRNHLAEEVFYWYIIKGHTEKGKVAHVGTERELNLKIRKPTFPSNHVLLKSRKDVKIGDNCIIAGQVGFAGSSTLGNDVMIGGQAGVSGHLKIGNNVQIGGGCGVIKDIPDNSKVMGYPAKDLKSFIKENQ